jgi:hypothetical protein
MRQDLACNRRNGNMREKAILDQATLQHLLSPAAQGKRNPACRADGVRTIEHGRLLTPLLETDRTVLND